MSRQRVRKAGAGVAGGLMPIANRGRCADDAGMSEAIWFYLGTYTGPHSKGIYLVRLDAATGTLDAPALACEEKNPSFLALHPTRPLLYAVCEVNKIDGLNGGAVAAFKIDPVSRTLTRLNERFSGGQGPCHVSIDATGRCVMVANYSSGKVASFPLADDGSLGAMVSNPAQEGTGPVASRQDHAYAHSIYPDPSGRFAVSCDLGADKLFVYGLNPQTAALTPGDPPSHALDAGSGPRHLAFSPDGKFAYVINELANTVTTLSWDSSAGRFKTLQTINSMQQMPATYSEDNKAAEILVHPGGKFVYASNRGADDIAVFAVGADHLLSPVDFTPTQGKGPRSFGIDKSGRFLVAANEKSDSLTAFAIDSATGKLTPKGSIRNIGRPVCVRFCE